jgi:hypothetical protein
LAIIALSAESTGTPAPSSAFGPTRARRLRVDLDRLVGLGVDVLGARVDRGQGDLVGVDLAVAGDRDQPARLELPGDGAGAGELAAGLREDRADLRGGAVAVVGRRLDEDRHAAGP